MLGQMGSFARPSSSTGDPLDLYVHGYVSSRLMNLGRKHISENGETETGMPVCVAASQVDGLVLALAAFSHSCNYRSAVLFGYATLVTDVEEKTYALEQITNGIVPDRWNHTRLPLTNAELQSTSVLKIRIVSGSAKIRTGNAGDERGDMENDQLRDGTWTGVLPVYTSIGSPVASDYAKVAVPAHVKDFIEGYNRESREYCVESTKKK
jgi:nitroimidazol reductase NimA-like FMN-containing flavoprotein (pyridoxamine 5'-phosphate oxidase superfamily)